MIILPCSHEFHKTCLLKLINKQGQLKCPLCRQSTTTPATTPITPTTAATAATTATATTATTTTTTK